mmetsp:Transcript_42820/g.84407  ORF Transcript_42820/g.84407 Transcript_42820/m.84407 type:complete len:372 (-) Transcript_42820:25-1140(-)
MAIILPTNGAIATATSAADFSVGFGSVAGVEGASKRRRRAAAAEAAAFWSRALAMAATHRGGTQHSNDPKVFELGRARFRRRSHAAFNAFRSKFVEGQSKTSRATTRGTSEAQMATARCSELASKHRACNAPNRILASSSIVSFSSSSREAQRRFSAASSCWSFPSSSAAAAAPLTPPSSSSSSSSLCPRAVPFAPPLASSFAFTAAEVEVGVVVEVVVEGTHSPTPEASSTSHNARSSPDDALITRAKECKLLGVAAKSARGPLPCIAVKPTTTSVESTDARYRPCWTFVLIRAAEATDAANSSAVSSTADNAPSPVLLSSLPAKRNRGWAKEVAEDGSKYRKRAANVRGIDGGPFSGAGLSLVVSALIF